MHAKSKKQKLLKIFSGRLIGDVKMDGVEEQGASSRVLAGGTASGVNVSLHPLVIMNISDHFTRVRVQHDEGEPPIGAQ